MSCFVVPDNHISTIIRYACRAHFSVHSPRGDILYKPGDEQHAGDVLYYANALSVNTRYGLDEPLSGFVYKPEGPVYRPIEIVKLCDCLAYQCSEWEDFETSDAKHLLDMIQRYAVRKLPGYDTAPWSIA